VVVGGVARVKGRIKEDTATQASTLEFALLHSDWAVLAEGDVFALVNGATQGEVRAALALSALAFCQSTVTGRSAVGASAVGTGRALLLAGALHVQIALAVVTLWRGPLYL
jgi:hypothetical protein